MGFDNRDYARSTPLTSSSGGGSGTPVCRFLLITTIAVYLLQIFSVRDLTPEEAHDNIRRMVELQGQELNEDEIDFDEMTRYLPTQRVSLIQEWLQLDTDKVLHGQVWRLLTCAFCHDRDGIWHILMNMLFFWWFGLTLESMYGSREFLLFYLTSAVAASVAFVGLDLVTGDPRPMIGASGAVMAVTMLFALHFPTHTILLFFVFPIEVRWLVLMYAIFDLHPVLLALSGDNLYDGVAHSAHLGGLAFGFFYGRNRWRLDPYWSSFERSVKRRSLRRPKLRIHRPSTAAPAAESDVDEILAKIHESGEESLTDRERDVLADASRRLRNRRGR